MDLKDASPGVAIALPQNVISNIPVPDFPHAAFVDLQTGNIIIVRLRDGQNMCSLIESSALYFDLKLYPEEPYANGTEPEMSEDLVSLVLAERGLSKVVLTPQEALYVKPKQRHRTRVCSSASEAVQAGLELVSVLTLFDGESVAVGLGTIRARGGNANAEIPALPEFRTSTRPWGGDSRADLTRRLKCARCH